MLDSIKGGEIAMYQSNVKNLIELLNESVKPGESFLLSDITNGSIFTNFDFFILEIIMKGLLKNSKYPNIEFCFVRINKEFEIKTIDFSKTKMLDYLVFPYKEKSEEN